MAFQVSAGVEVKEIDLTNVVPAVSTSIGGYAGQFRWGPIEEIKLIGSETELANEFGKPDAYHARSFFTASSFLKYGSALKVVRSTDDGQLNATNVSPGGRIVSIAVDASPVSGSVLGNINSSTKLGNNNYTINSTIGSGATVNPVYEVESVTVVSGGANYSDDDEVRVDLGGGKELILDVNTVVGGVVQDGNETIKTNVEIETPTAFSNLVTNATAGNGSDGGSGSGLIVSVVYQLKSLTIVNGGSNYSPNVDLTGAPYGEFIGAPTGGVNASPKLVIFKDGVEIYPKESETKDSALSPSIAPAGSATGVLIKNEDHFDSLGAGLTNAVYSRYAGALGNSTNVYVVSNSNANSLQIGTGTTAGTLANAQFDSTPSSGELHVLITSSAGALTDSGTTETVVERWPFVETSTTAKKADGTNNYVVDVINKGSDWIFAKSGITTAGKYDLSQGADASSRTDGKVTQALEKFSDSETVDVNLLFTEADTNGSTTLANKVLSIATGRKDAVAFITPAIEDTVNNTDPLGDVLDFLQSTSAVITPRDSYGVLGSTAVYIYDKYNDKFLYTGTQGHLAGLCANTDQVAQPWFSPGGFNRGQLKGVTKLAFNPTKIQRDELYKAGVNPIVTFPGPGTVLFGDKTLQAKPSAFDRINVRRLFITLEKAIATAAKFQLFELNDEFTRAAFRNLVEPFLRDVQGRRGITDFLVVCDETNNTGQVIDTNRFVADIYIKPARSINFITLNFIATRTGVDFSEIVGNV